MKLMICKGTLRCPYWGRQHFLNYANYRPSPRQSLDYMGPLSFQFWAIDRDCPHIIGPTFPGNFSDLL